MAKVFKLEPKHTAAASRSRRAPEESPLTPALREFIDRAIVPILVKEYLALEDLENGLADERSDAAHSERYTAALELRTVRP